jgi:hypothetical protein
VVDVGAIVVDTVAIVVDAGAIVVDVGAIVVDVGAIVVDAGAIVVDAGAIVVGGLHRATTASASTPRLRALQNHAHSMFYRNFQLSSLVLLKEK